MGERLASRQLALEGRGGRLAAEREKCPDDGKAEEIKTDQDDELVLGATRQREQLMRELKLQDAGKQAELWAVAQADGGAIEIGR